MNEPIEPDARDERIAALLEVPPLDEVSRRRLVRAALDQPAPRAGSSRWLSAASVAAALAIGALLGVVLVNDPPPSDTTTAQGATPSSSADLEALESAPAAGSELAAGPVTLLGDLGDVTQPADLRAALDVGFQRALGPTEDTALARAYPCGGNPPGDVGLVAASALGTGTYAGEAVTVFVGTSPEGQALAVVARAAGCTVVASVALDDR